MGNFEMDLDGSTEIQRSLTFALDVEFCYPKWCSSNLSYPDFDDITSCFPRSKPVSSIRRDANKMEPDGKYVRYTPEQVEALERVYNDCPKPNSFRRQQLIRECPILSNIEPKQNKVWFQYIRCREKQRKEAARLQGVNRILTAMNKLLMEENDRLQKQVAHLVYENSYFRQQTQNRWTNMRRKQESGNVGATTSTRPQLYVAQLVTYRAIDMTLKDNLTAVVGNRVVAAGNSNPLR